jgi:Cysteine rich repeat
LTRHSPLWLVSAKALAASAVFSVISALGLQTSAHAQVPSAEQRAALRACRADARSLCADVETGEGRVMSCLGAHADRLSPGCRAEIAKLEACSADIRTLCPDAKGSEALHACAKEKRDRLSPSCRGLTGR